jgi:hypothetical protein
MLRVLVVGFVLIGLPGFAPAAPLKAKRPRPPAAAAAPAKPLSPPEEAIRTVKQNIERLARDEYAEQDPIDQFVGRGFNVEIKPTTTYKDGVLEIYLLTHNIYPNEKDDFSSRHRFENHPGVELKPVLANKRGSYVGENAFGVQVAVSRIDLDYAVLMFMNRPRDSQYLVRVRLPGPDAKLLSQSATVVVTGTVARSESDKVAGCSSTYSSPTIDSPYSGRAQTCWTAVQLQSLSIVDKRSGRVLRQWTPSDPEASILNKPEPIELSPNQ